MTRQRTIHGNPFGKVLAIGALGAVAAAIAALGLLYGIYGLLSGIAFPMLGTTVPGWLFGAIALFLGIRYLASVRRLWTAVRAPTARFELRNFRSSKEG